MAEPVVIRELRDDECAWADARYRAIQFATTPPGSLALVAERGGDRIGLGRLVTHAPGVVAVAVADSSQGHRLRRARAPRRRRARPLRRRVLAPQRPVLKPRRRVARSGLTSIARSVI